MVGCRVAVGQTRCLSSQLSRLSPTMASEIEAALAATPSDAPTM